MSDPSGPKGKNVPPLRPPHPDMQRGVVHSPTMPGYHDDLGLKKIVVEMCCNNCQHSDKRHESIIEYLRARGISQVTDAHGQAVPGENTIAKDFDWGELIPRLDDILLCRAADKTGGPGCEMVTRAFCCVRWEEDRGHIVVPSNWGDNLKK